MQQHGNDLHHKYAFKWQIRRREGYRFLTGLRSHHQLFLKKAQEIQRSCGQEDVKRGRQQRQPERKEKEGRETERAAGKKRDRRDEKRWWFIASCYSMMISCLAVLSQILTKSIYCCWITCSVTICGKFHRHHSGDQKINVSHADIFTMCAKLKHINSLVVWNTNVCVTFIASVSQFLCVFCS